MAVAPRLLLALFGLSLLVIASDACGKGPRSAAGEHSRTPLAVAPQWRLKATQVPRHSQVRYGELGITRLLKLQRDNATRQRKAVQVGIARSAAHEAQRPLLAPLHWIPVRGGAAARIEVHSPDALALRVGLRLDRLDDRVELRFAGSDAPLRVVALITGRQANTLAAGTSVFWTPSTDGESQLIELFRPHGVPADAVRVQAPHASHLLANSRNDFKIIEKIGESGTCNVDTTCRVADLGQRFVNAKNAVAHMQFVQGANTYICTGTLLADTTGATQVPYFWSAHHCFAGGGSSQALMSQVAATLNTFWNYEATACGSGVSTPRVQLSGGAAYLYSDSATDAMLLRLNTPAPSGAFFAGWNAGVWGDGPVLAIHHPSGDAKKVSVGQAIGRSATRTTTAWTGGTTEGGSSGSGLFTLARDGYELRGGLYGGTALCPNSGDVNNPQNRDYYSRLDAVFPAIAQYLAAEPVPMNGAAPRLPPDVAPASAGEEASRVGKAVRLFQRGHRAPAAPTRNARR